MDTLTPTSINSPIAALSNAKKILGLSDEFDKFLNSSCKKHTKLDLESFCHYAFFSYFTLDKGSLSYLKRLKTIPKDLFIPEKNREGKRIIFTQVDLKNNITNNKNNYDLPEYIIIGPVEKEFINNENLLRKSLTKLSINECTIARLDSVDVLEYIYRSNLQYQN